MQQGAQERIPGLEIPREPAETGKAKGRSWEDPWRRTRGRVLYGWSLVGVVQADSNSGWGFLAGADAPLGCLIVDFIGGFVEFSAL